MHPVEHGHGPDCQLTLQGIAPKPEVLEVPTEEELTILRT
jgi:hypothetical protein